MAQHHPNSEVTREAKINEGKNFNRTEIFATKVKKF